MRIKVSRFEDPEMMMGGGPIMQEDFIPNEEPLIHVREFRGNNMNRQEPEPYLNVGELGIHMQEFPSFPHPRMMDFHMN